MLKNSRWKMSNRNHRVQMEVIKDVKSSVKLGFLVVKYIPLRISVKQEI